MKNVRDFLSTTRGKFMAAGAALALAAVVLVTCAENSQAATQNYSLETEMVLIPVHLDGQFTANTDDVATIKLPFAAKVVGISVTARASGGSSPTLTIDVSDDGTSLLSSVISVTAGTVSEGTLASVVNIADESEITIDLAIGGSSPTWDDIDILITLVRR